MGAFARGFRLAGLPLRMSQGFNPRPRFSLPAPLPVGIEGLDEPLELDLVQPLEPDELRDRLQPALPEGVRLISVESAPPDRKARAESAVYRVTGPLPPGSIERTRDAQRIDADRPDGRVLDVRRYLNRIEPCEGGCEFEIAMTPEGSARPAEILAALCIGEPALITRLALVRTAVSLAPPHETEHPEARSTG